MHCKTKFLPALLFFVPWVAYFSYIWAFAIQVSGEGWFAAYIPHWGDGIAHLSYMAPFTYRDTFPTVHPLFLSHPFSYSFAADMIGGLIARIGIPSWIAYNLWGGVLTIATLVLTWISLKKLLQSSWLTVGASNLFLLSGGLGFKYLLIDQLFPEDKPTSHFFFSLLTQRENSAIAWLNVIVGELIPQRALLMALPLGLGLLMLWYKRFVLGNKVNHLLLFFSGVVLGLMPVIHPHSLMFVTSCVGVWSGVALIQAIAKRSKTDIKEMIISTMVIAIPAIIIGALLIAQFILPSVSSGFFRWYPGWLARSKDINWLIFWIENWGIFLPTALIGTVMLCKRPLLLILVPTWIWFVLTNLFLFQPYDWDNSKLLTWVYLFFTIPVILVVQWLWQRRWYFKMSAVLMVIVLMASGFHDVIKLLDVHTHKLQIVNSEELGLASYVRLKTPTDAIFLTSTTHRNWVPILTGRQILCGYLGWMWTYGITADSRVADIKEMYRGTPAGDELIRHYGIDYIVVGPEEKNEFKVNEIHFASTYPIATRSENTVIYQVVQ